MKKIVSVLIPCLNEEGTIGNVIDGFRKYLPDAKIYVYDNNSTDRTVEIAKKHGAIVRKEEKQGKGYVVRKMFREIDSDYYILVDGDDTYDPSISVEMVKLAEENGYDLVNCIRKESSKNAYRSGHKIGNAFFNKVVSLVFGKNVDDMLSGYKLLSRKFVKSFPSFSNGFDIETEMTIHALELSLPIANVCGEYRQRPNGSFSKLKTFRDGIRILKLIFNLARHEKPLQTFTIISVLLALISLLLGIPVVIEYFKTKLVLRFPTAILAASIMLLAYTSFITGIILDGIARSKKEVKMLFYQNSR